MANNITLKVMANLVAEKVSTAEPERSVSEGCRLSSYEIELLKDKIYSDKNKSGFKPYKELPESANAKYGMSLNELAKTVSK